MPLTSDKAHSNIHMFSPGTKMSSGRKHQSSLTWREHHQAKTKTVKLPAPIYSHSLAHAPSLTPDNLLNFLKADRECGFTGMTVVPATFADGFSEKDLVNIARASGMQLQICGFFPPNGPNPLVDESRDAAIAVLAKNIAYAVALAEAGLGPRRIVGPNHVQWKSGQSWSVEGLKAWLDAANKVAERTESTILFEPLNDNEDPTPDAFNTVFKEITEFEFLQLHYDTGHAYRRQMVTFSMQRMASRIGFVELVDPERRSLKREMIDLAKYQKVMAHLPEGTIIGLEPFCYSVIDTFNVGDLCKPDIDGPECLETDLRHLKQIGIAA